MKKINLLYLGLSILPQIVSGQCTNSLGTGNNNATTCVCPPGGGTNCDLIPDITVAKLPLNQTSNYTEYPQVCNPPCSGNDGRLRVGVSTPIIGYGPLETRGTTWYVCGTDTINAGSLGNIPATCPITGFPPKQLINQRIFHKTGNTMTAWDRPAGSMTFHASHGHQHIDDWDSLTLRINNGNPNPKNWPIVGTGSKVGFCLIDLGNCTSSSGFCVDSLGNTLNSSNIPNYGLGGGNYGCNQTVQGITNGYMDTYSQGLDGMWVNIPPGVCNGTYWLVVEVDPYNYFLETNENNNIVAVPITLTQQTASGTASITANKSSNICVSDNIILTANSGSGYLWNTGATTQSITVNTAGNYIVTVTNTCGTGISSPFVVTTFGSSPPITTGASVCGSGSGVLQATGTGTINWYDALTGGNFLATGNSYTTPIVNTTTNYYADATTASGGQTLFCPPAANTIGGGGQYNASQYLTFNVSATCTLVSAKIYADVAGTFTVQLQNSSGSIINSISKTVPAGESRINLNFPLSIGTGYRLTRSGNFSLYRNNSGVAYPYNITNYVSITGSSAGSAFYYFFYDWEVNTPVVACASLRSVATLTRNPNPNATITPAGPTTFCSGKSVIINALVNPNFAYVWKKNGFNISGATSSSFQATGSGTYTVRITNTSTGCSAVTPTGIVVIKNPLPTATISPAGTITICAGQSALMTANSGTGCTYKWKKTGNYISGATSITYSATTAGKYKVEVTNSFGCSKTSVNDTINVPCREGVSENEFSVSIYPNPSSGDFIFKLNTANDKNISIRIFDMTGKLIENKMERVTQSEFRISGLSPGIYSAEVINEHYKKVLKLVKTE